MRLSHHGIRLHRYIGVCLLFVGVAANAQDLLFSNVNVISVTTGEILPDQSVYVSDGWIVAIGQLENENAFQVIDGNSGYLIPGLAEMHAHVPSAGRGEQYARDIMTLFLANGITTIRGMLGESWHLELRHLLDQQHWPGPHLVTSGPSFNGNSVSSPAQAANRVREQKSAGYDFLKLHPGLEADEFAAIAETASELAIPIAGHVSVAVGLGAALKANQATIDHLDGYAQELVPPGSDLYGVAPTFFGINLASALDPVMTGELARRTAEAGVWNVPTQSLFENIYGGESIEALLDRPGMTYLGAGLKNSWVKSVEQARNGVTTAQQESFILTRRRLAYELQQAGAGLLLGSDAPQIMNVPGFSTHEELRLLVLAGLTPLQAIQTGTINPARFFGYSDRGKIAAGQMADLVLLQNNPLENILATRNIQGVMRGGQWYSKEQLEKMLADVAKRGL
jgi:imidazolonepropionase-like amidohydrolase